jgi:conjugative relaxase-like TrwC/TraI family protein
VVADLHKLAVGREDYYTREIANNREEYLSGHGESPGVFHGGSARALGLEGECSPEAFKRLFAWQDPRTGEQLGRAPRQDAMPAWDLVFRPHKDVSILYALGDEATGRKVAEAHQAGVRAAVAYLDSQVGTRTGRHGAEHVQGEGLLAVGFTHRTSRADDPLLHTHLIITNRTQGPDGQWRTLDSRDLLNHRATADAMYQAAYQAELTRTLGVRWAAPDRWGNRAIQGMPEELRRGFSKRHQQISAELQRQEANGTPRTPKLVQKVVHATRPAKSHETPETLYGRWQQEARDLGYEPDRLVRQVTGRERSREQDPTRTAGHDSAAAAAPGGTPAGLAGTLTATAGPPERTITTMFDRLASPEGLTAQASTFTRPQVLCAVGRELPAEAAGTVGPAGLETLADRFLAERAVSVVSEHAIGERHCATPELLAVEQRLIEAAVDRAGEQTSVCSHDTLRETLTAHPTIGADQAAMVRDITQGGQGVSVVAAKAGTGKTYTLGVARHAWQLEGYRVLGAAPTGIATVCLDAEGFEHSRTVDALLGELDKERAAEGRRRLGGRQATLSRTRQPPPGRSRDTTRIERARDDHDQGERVLDERTVLVVDEAGMLGSRKLARLLDHAAEARAKVVLVGDDKQLASIDAGGGFRGLRLRLGASTLTENRRQAEPWERQAVEHLRDGNIDAALSAYREHERLVAVETPGQLKETMLADWWRSFQQGNRVVILAYRRDEVDQFNTACQQLRDASGQLGAERLVVRDRGFAVGDRVVCGKNAITSLGVANGSRGQVVALDLEQRAMTLKLEDGREVAVPGEYLDQRPARWVGNNPERRTVDLAYASTGHKSQGGTWDEVLLRVTGAEDRQWLHVGGSRAIGRTRYYSVISPEPALRQDREREMVDVPAADRTPKQQAEQMAAVARRDGSKRLAADTTAPVDGRRMSKHDLRAELHRLGDVIAKAPRDQSRLLALATRRREQHEQRLAEATTRRQEARNLVALLEHGPARWLRRGDLGRVREQAKQADEAYQVARQAADRAADRERAARHQQQQQQYQAHQEANPDLRERRRELLRVQAWRQRADARAVEVLRPEWSRELGERPATVKGGRVWDRAVEQAIEYRQRWDVEDAEHLLGREPHGPDASLEQRQAWRHATRAVGRMRGLAGDRDRTDRGERGDHREATGRGDHAKATSRSDCQGDHRGDHEATGRADHRGDRWSDRRRPLDRERDYGHERAM